MVLPLDSIRLATDFWYTRNACVHGIPDTCVPDTCMCEVVGAVAKELCAELPRRLEAVLFYGGVDTPFVADHVPTTCDNCAHITRMRCALDGSAPQVCATLLRSAPLGGANVRTPARCGHLRSGDHGRLVQSQDLVSSGAVPADAGSSDAAGVGLVHQC